MRKKIVGKEYGRRLYVEGKYDMRRVTEKFMSDEFIYKQSEFKKPYRTRNYAQMEYGRSPTHWDALDNINFDMPGGYPGLKSRYYYYSFGCQGEKIGYTTLNMFNGESQELTIENGQSFHQYEWDVKGNGGTRFDLDGSFVTTDSQGNAPSTTYSPTNAKGNITIQLKDRESGNVCDEITMFVGPEGGWTTCTWQQMGGQIYIGTVGSGDNGSYSAISDYTVPQTGYYRLSAFGVCYSSETEWQIKHDLEYFYLNAGDCFGPYSWYCLNAVCNCSYHSIPVCPGTAEFPWQSCSSYNQPDL